MSIQYDAQPTSCAAGPGRACAAYRRVHASGGLSTTDSIQPRGAAFMHSIAHVDSVRYLFAQAGARHPSHVANLAARWRACVSVATWTTVGALRLTRSRCQLNWTCTGSQPVQPHSAGSPCLLPASACHFLPLSHTHTQPMHHAGHEDRPSRGRGGSVRTTGQGRSEWAVSCVFTIWCTAPLPDEQLACGHEHEPRACLRSGGS